MTGTLTQRPLRGSRISSFYPVKSLPSLSSLDSAFQLQEYISLLIRLDVHDVNAIVTVPETSSSREKKSSGNSPIDDESKQEGNSPDAEKERRSETAVDEACWIYEQLRRLAQDLSHPLITMLQQECKRTSCPEMKAGEWLYLCVAHGNDGTMEQCCAIDYILHTLDSATALLNSPRAFPSRLSIPQTSHRHFSSLARRLGRIFAHAYFHHREAFEQAEAESSLYARFLALTSKFDLVPMEFLVIPSRAERAEAESRGDGDGFVKMPTLLRPSTDDKADRSVELDERQELRQELLHQDIRPVEEWPKQVEQLPTENPPDPSQANSSDADGHRKIGRPRTDTMVFSEGFVVTEELKDIDGDLSELVPDPSKNVVDPKFFEPTLPIQTPPSASEDLTLSQPTHDDTPEKPEKDADVGPADVAPEQTATNSDRPVSPPLDLIDPEPENHPTFVMLTSESGFTDKAQTEDSLESDAPHLDTTSLESDVSEISHTVNEPPQEQQPPDADAQAGEQSSTEPSAQVSDTTDNADTPSDNADTPPDNADTPPDIADTPPDNADTPPDNADTLPDSAATLLDTTHIDAHQPSEDEIVPLTTISSDQVPPSHEDNTPPPRDDGEMQVDLEDKSEG